MSLLNLHLPAKGDKLAHDVEIAIRCMGDHGHNRRLSADIVEVKGDLVQAPHS